MSADPVDFAKALARKHAPKTSDDALALLFAERHADKFRYVAAWGAWMLWQDGCWVRDEKMTAWDCARAVCRDVAGSTKAGNARKLGAAATTAAVLAHARADQRLAATVDQWDSDPWLLNTPAGIVDLHSGEIGAHDRDAYCSKITAAAPSDEVRPDSLWLRFLLRVCGNDVERVTFLKRAVGYSISGSTREEVFFFLHGGGQNGKTKFIEAITGALGDYHQHAAMSTFCETKQDTHPTDLANLQGARLVSAVETRKGRRWDETKIKSITGGDAISARRMRQDFFTFKPICKIWIAGNEKPRLTSVDKAMRRRLILVPFDQVIREGERDPDLAEKLRSEWPIILRWAIDGCLEYQRHRLAAPAAVAAATDDYFAEQDTISEWLAECCVVGVDRRAASRELWTSWAAWAEAAKAPVGNRVEFGEALQRQKFEPVKGANGSREYRGVGLK